MGKLTLLVAFVVGLAARADDVPYLEQARTTCATRLGVDPTSLMNTMSGEALLPLQETTLYRHKFACVESAATCSVSYRSGGEEVNEGEALSKEAGLRFEQYGAMEPEDYAHVSTLPPNTRVAAYIALTPPAVVPDFRSKEEPYNAKAEFTPQYSDSFAAQVRNSFPDSNAQPVPAAFGVTAWLTAQQVLDVARWPGVARVYADEVFELLSTPTWYKTMVLDRIHLTTQGDSGRLGVIEFGAWDDGSWGGSLALLPSVQVLRDGTGVGEVSYHLGRVIGIMSNTSVSAQPGSSPNGTFLYAGASQRAGDGLWSQREAADMLLREGVDAINISFHEGFPNLSDPDHPIHRDNPGGFGWYLDEQARHLGATIVAGAGNDARMGGTFERVASPANAINVIAVGMFYDGDSQDWWDDQTELESSWTNPPGVYRDRMKPDLIAPGSHAWMVSPNAGNYLAFETGTSFAAPMITGTVGLIADLRRSNQLSPLGPETNRAILLTAARHAVQSNRVSQPVAPYTFPWVHMGQWDGAGSVDAEVIKEIVTAGWIGQTTLFSCPASQSQMALPGAHFDLQRGQRARATMVFSSAPTEFYTPTADFDLLVARVDPATGSVIQLNAWSTYADSNVENIEFQAEADGRYQLFLSTLSCGWSEPRYVGYAWWFEP